MNVDDILRSAQRDAATWTESAALDVANSLAAGATGDIDWDPGAGEAWIRVVDGPNVTAFVSVSLPIAIIEESAFPLDCSCPIGVIRVESLSDPSLTAHRDVLEAVFRESARFDELDPDGFSANDLWYTTV